jgi:hypothetical protein
VLGLVLELGTRHRLTHGLVLELGTHQRQKCLVVILAVGTDAFHLAFSERVRGLARGLGGGRVGTRTWCWEVGPTVVASWSKEGRFDFDVMGVAI